MTGSSEQDIALRCAMFQWLERALPGEEDMIDRNALLRGVPWQDQRIPLIHPAGRGIWKPKSLRMPLSLLTTAGSPYDDHFADGRLVYSYQGRDPGSSDNRAVRLAMETATPLVYFHAVVPGLYFTAWPVYVVGDEPASLRFWVQPEPAGVCLGGATIQGRLAGASILEETARRAYGTSLVKTRLHQRGFRERVLAAYQSRCAMCRLKHRKLLDAAHIIPDSEPLGDPVLPNGLSLCKIHHAAFDARVLGVDPDSLRVAVRRDVLEEVDGPMLRHGIQEMDGHRLWVPRSAAKRPDPARLEIQWQRFREVG